MNKTRYDIQKILIIFITLYFIINILLSSLEVILEKDKLMFIIKFIYFDYNNFTDASMLFATPLLPDNKEVAVFTATPLKIFENLDDKSKISLYGTKEFNLKGQSGIYAFINKINGKQYIGSSKDLHLRLRAHLEESGVKSNIALQNAFKKYGKQNFKFVIYAYCPYVLPDILDLETLYISYFPFDSLYNVNSTAKLNLIKLKERLANNIKTPTKGFLGQTHTVESRKKISRPKSRNPMFGKKHSKETLDKLSLKKSTPTYLYNENKEYFLTFKNNTQLSKFLNCFKGTVGRYIKSGKLYKAEVGNFYISKNSYLTQD